MPGKNKAQLEEELKKKNQEIDFYQQELRDSEMRYNQLLNEKELQFKALPVYMQMAEKIELLERSKALDQKKITRLQEKVQELQTLLCTLEEKYKQLQESVKNSSAIFDTVHNARNAGRKPKPEEKIQQQIQQLEKLLKEGKKEKAIYTEMGISRSTYYRLKKYIKSH